MTRELDGNARFRSRSGGGGIARAFALLGLAASLLIPATLAAAAQVGTTGSSGTSTTATTGVQTLFGTTVSSRSDLSTKTIEFGHMPIIHTYYTGLPPTDAWSSTAAAVNHSAVVVSFFARPSAVLSGAAVPAIRHFFDTAPSAYPIYYSYIHEPEANIQAGQFTAAQYRSAWQRVVQLANGAHNSALRATLILMGWTVDPASHRNWRDYMPGGGIIHNIAWDVYPDGGYGVAPPSDWMGPEVKVSKAAGLHFGFAEFNTTTQTGRPAWLKSVGQYCKGVGASFCTLFDSKQIGGLARHGGTFLVTDSASILAWRWVIHNL